MQNKEFSVVSRSGYKNRVIKRPGLLRDTGTEDRNGAKKDMLLTGHALPKSGLADGQTAGNCLYLYLGSAASDVAPNVGFGGIGHGDGIVAIEFPRHGAEI